ncbi:MULTISPECIES: 3-hydroxyacyl-CoA dehydrogenase NAD-binding domain-containing protein [Nitrospirillum]|uniref:3-hydroxyacyl-CoA dehydrogenase n=1 Tax=Nitrospirillum amazonense TaxID=28077 RepID=A0A560FVU2_9PROT|nr:3-hydroxyacyl-CoA dehydrogenase NAD-binding domain-containing protein [Nitrospirillum amazonense]MEC4594339.1 3-hydroxyacyl-CoA dehydrogenase NAD-binding domain-containing protein [Nitrospirillum amazonense]TWB25758.1 3-hydroxyacyl-CoA dehydrogenase [Nitrospirillum amazonense]
MDASGIATDCTPVRYERQGRTGIITVNQPPVNALGQAVRAGLLRALALGQADGEADLLVLLAAGRTFMAGADIREFGQAPLVPFLPDVVAALEASPKPVIAVLHGTALGGGLEVALGCHFRVALPGTRLGLPEVKLGLLPGAGGTQRLPRLVGPAKALEMIVSGDPVTTAAALDIGLVDWLAAEPEPLAAGLAFAKRVRAKGLMPRRTGARGDRIAAVSPLLFSAVRDDLARKSPHLFAPHRCVDAVEAACTLPLAEGLKRERELFLACMDSPQRAGLIHSFFAERAVAKVPGLAPDLTPRPVDRVGVIGAGTMGGGIAMCFANAKIPTVLLDTTQEALDRGLATIRRNYQASVARGKLSQEEADARLGLIRPRLDYGDLADADLVIEAVFESMDLKKQIFTRLDQVCRPGAILATNTSTLDVDAIAAVTSRPQDVAGLHFFSPANVMRLLEVVRGRETAPDVLATAMDVARRIGKVGVAVGVCYGFVGNRMLHQRAREATALVDEGAAPDQVDRVLTDFGFPMGPFAMGDLAGLDVGWRIREERRKAGDPDTPPPGWLDRLAEQGRHGQKTGAGIYRYEAGSRTPLPDPVTADLIARDRAAKGITPRSVTDQEILERCLYVMVNEAAKILEEGVAARALDVDMIWVHGYGFPAWRGGPLFWADQVGLGTILGTITKFHQASGAKQWQPAPLLERLVRDGHGFASLN